jgi:hypothetical protein
MKVDSVHEMVPVMLNVYRHYHNEHSSVVTRGQCAYGINLSKSIEVSTAVVIGKIMIDAFGRKSFSIMGTFQ